MSTETGETATDSETEEKEIVNNRSEIVFLYDAQDCNPNGNPLSGADRPRMDPRTEQNIVTDVRLKRYLRDQLVDDGYPVYLANVEQEDGTAPTREYLIKRAINAEPGDIGPEVFDEFLDGAIDARLFGATFSLSSDGDDMVDAIDDHLPDNLTGPVQFQPGRSIHPVATNENYDSLTSIIATKEGKEQGGYGLDDHRIVYSLLRFHGTVDPTRGDQTQLTETDVEHLDTLCWRALKNQTTTRSKTGQDPQLYLRVEYRDKATYLGRLGDQLEIDSDFVDDPKKMRTTSDAVVDVTEMVNRLESAANRIDTIHVVAGDLLNITYDGVESDNEYLYTTLENIFGEDTVHVINVYEESKATPSAETTN